MCQNCPCSNLTVGWKHCCRPICFKYIEHRGKRRTYVEVNRDVLNMQETEHRNVRLINDRFVIELANKL
jgi:hypothetical protein